MEGTGTERIGLDWMGLDRIGREAGCLSMRWLLKAERNGWDWKGLDWIGSEAGRVPAARLSFSFARVFARPAQNFV